MFEIKRELCYGNEYELRELEQELNAMIDKFYKFASVGCSFMSSDCIDDLMKAKKRVVLERYKLYMKNSDDGSLFDMIKKYGEEGEGIVMQEDHNKICEKVKRELEQEEDLKELLSMVKNGV